MASGLRPLLIVMDADFSKGASWDILGRLQDRDDTRDIPVIMVALDAGVPLRDVQEAASHADPRTTMRYDRARVSLDRHATYIVAAYLAGAAR